MVRRPPTVDHAAQRVDAAYGAMHQAAGADAGHEQEEDELLTKAEQGIQQAAEAVAQLKQAQEQKEGHQAPSGGEADETGSPSAQGQA